jgi:hypothetical protein
MAFGCFFLNNFVPDIHNHKLTPFIYMPSKRVPTNEPEGLGNILVYVE